MEPEMKNAISEDLKAVRIPPLENVVKELVAN